MSNKYNFLKQEEHWRKFWQDNEIYKFDSKSKKPFYSVDTPPPYVSAEHLHVGHVMSYAQAEFVVRYKRMRGFEVFYPMGFDDNGLPTERYVEKKYNLNKNNIRRSDFIKKCLAETKLGAENYQRLWQLLGISVDWSKTYSTINNHSQKISQWSFIDLYKKGKMTRKEEPSYWCTSCQTAVAQADLEDREEEGLINYLKFKSVKGSQEFLIATSRPELLAACVAVFVHPTDKRYKEIVGTKILVPLYNYTVPLLTSDEVDVDFGTGMMMVCTWGDGEDVKKVKEYNLPIRAVLGKDGKLNHLALDLQGLDVVKAREKIIASLKKEKLLVKQEKITHALNVHERCATPVEFVKTKQWFIDVLSLKDKLIAQADEMKWFPDHMKTRYYNWVKTLKWDWCISRQRYYGVPFPVWYCQKCQAVVLAQEKDLPVDPIQEIPKVKKCHQCGGDKFVPEKDVMDTWMTSSLTPLIGAKLVKEKRVQDKLYPATLRPQAFEIIRTWLFYTVVKSFYHHKIVPFHEIMISGHGLDEQGRKISKRLGNFVPPYELIEKYSADALRYWATGATLGENLRYNESEVKKGKRTVTKLYNAAQFCFLHFKDEDYFKFSGENLKPEDKWILHHFNETIGKVTKYFESYEYAKARDAIDGFFWHFLTDNYLEFVKHRLYQDAPDKTAKTVLYQVLSAVIKIYAPILPFVTEELYQAYFKTKEKEKSIHLSGWPQEIKIKWDKKEIGEFEQVVEVVKEIRKHKSENQISLGKEIDEFKTKIKVPKKYFDFIKSVARVKKLISK